MIKLLEKEEQELPENRRRRSKNCQRIGEGRAGNNLVGERKEHALQEKTGRIRGRERVGLCAG